MDPGGTHVLGWTVEREWRNVLDHVLNAGNERNCSSVRSSVRRTALGGLLLGRLNVAMLCSLDSRNLEVSRATRSDIQVRFVDLLCCPRNSCCR